MEIETIYQVEIRFEYPDGNKYDRAVKKMDEIFFASEKVMSVDVESFTGNAAFCPGVRIKGDNKTNVRMAMDHIIDKLKYFGCTIENI
jgi:hypothetical protein